MATTEPLPTPVQEVAPSSELAPAAEQQQEEVSEVALEQVLAPMEPLPEEIPPMELSPAMARLPVELDIAIPVREFRVRNLLTLELGTVVETDWGNGQDMPLAAGKIQLAWSEFEVVDTTLAVRVTRLA